MENGTIEFLKELQYEMLTQDTCGYADPRFWVVCQKVKVYEIGENHRIDGIEIIHDGEIIEYRLKSMYDYLIDTEEDLNIQYIEEGLGEYILITDSNNNKEEIKTIEDLIKYMHQTLGYDPSELYITNYRIEDRITENTMFLTLKECKNHIENNLHRYENPYPYAMTALRSPQVKRLFEILQTTDWDNLK